MDTLKISILASYLCPNNDYNEGIFSRTPITRPDGRIGLKVAEPFLTRGLHSLVIFSDSFYHPGTLELEISAKILGKYYFWGISRETLHMVTQVILKMTGLYIQPEGFLEAMVHKVHLVNDCLTNHPQEILEALSMVSAINPKYKIEGIQGTSFLYRHTANSRTDSLNIYYKYPEFVKSPMCEICGEEGIDWAMKNIRLELRLTKHRIIRRYCGSNRLEDILSHRGNPVAEAFEEVFKNVDPDKHNYRPENLDDLKTAALIDIHGGDLDAIRRAISVVVDRSNLSKRMIKIRKVHREKEVQLLQKQGMARYFRELRYLVHQDR